MKLTESQLKQLITKSINEALEDEGLWDAFKGAGKKMGSDIASGAQNAFNKGKQTAGNVANAVKQAGQNAVQGVKNYAQDVKRAGQMSSMNADNQRIADQLQQWYKSGVFGNSRQVSSWVSGLVNCLNRNFSDRFGEDGSAKR